MSDPIVDVDLSEEPTQEPDLSFTEGLPHLIPLPERDFWILAQDWACFGFIVPAGFVTDLDSIPYTPFLHAYVKGRARWSALLHDYLYTGQHVSRKDADGMFYKAMLLEHVPQRIAKMMFWAVRLFGWRFYAKSNRKEKKVTRVVTRLSIQEAYDDCLDDIDL